MAALTAARQIGVLNGTQRSFTFPLKNGSTAWEGGVACYDTASAGSVTQGAVSTTLVPIGLFLSSPGLNSSGNTVPVQVMLFKEIEIWYFDVSGGGITIANLFAPVYMADDHSVTLTSTGASEIGRIFQLSPVGYPGGIGVLPVWGSP